jgi:hypothetical protein
VNNYVDLPETGGTGVTSVNGLTGAITLAAGANITLTPSGNTITIASTGSGSGSVTSFSFTNGGGFTGTVATPTTTPALSLVGTLSGDVTGSLTATTLTATTNSTITTLSALSLPYSQITGAPVVSGFTQGSVLFAGAGGGITQDNTNFFWNDTNFSLGLGTNVPASNTTIDAINTSGAAKSIRITGYGTGSSVGLKGQFARGTVGSPAPAQAGDLLNFLSGTGYGTSFPASTGVINVVAGETFSGTSNATYLQFEVTPTGSVTKAEKMRLNSTGNLLLQTVTDNGTDALQIGSGAYMSYLKLAGSTSGTIEQLASPTTTSYSVTWPAAQATGTQVLQNNGSGVLSWATNTGSGITRSVNSVSSATSAGSSTLTDYVYFVSGTTTITMPTAVSNTNRYSIKNTGSSTVTVATTSSQTIDGSVTAVINTPNASIDLVSDGSNWRIL